MKTAINLGLRLLIVLGFLLLAWLFFAPLPNSLNSSLSSRSTKLLDRHGKLLYELQSNGLGSQDWLGIKDIPQGFIDAALTAEDRGFYHHPGISLRGILRAFRSNLAAGEVKEGGSTITQQLVRRLTSPEKRDYRYKIREAWLALRLEAKLTKSQILEDYLNSAYFGHQAYGLASASRTFFGKKPAELSLAETSLLAGLLQSPSALDPFVNFNEAKKRQEVVLAAMVDTRRISDQQFSEAVSEQITLTSDLVRMEAPHFVAWVNSQLGEDLLGQREIETTLDLDLQKTIEEIVTQELGTLEEKNVTSASVVVLDAENGEVLAMVGSADYYDKSHGGAYNATLALRQPGSTLKPFTYALTLSRGDTAATTVADIEARFFTQEGNPYIPRNYDYGFHGLVRYREALANSYNIAAVKVLEKVGVPNLLRFLREAGITTLDKEPEHYGLALTLGDGEVKLLELAAAYSIFARGGLSLPVKYLPQQLVAPAKQVLDSRVAWLIADILSDSSARLAEFGEDSPLDFSFPVAAKTGTTRNSRDNWTIGFTSKRVVGVWVGNADNSPMRGTSGITGAGPIFHRVMEAAMSGLSTNSFARPSGIVRQEICRLSGKLPTSLCPHTLSEYFIAGTEPKDSDDVYQRLAIDQRNGLLAGETCDSRHVKQEDFTAFPLELEKWARESGYKLPPKDYSPFCPKSGEQSGTRLLQITRPAAGDSFRLDPLVPDENEKIILEARAAGDIKSVVWSVGEETIGIGYPPDFQQIWTPRAGQWPIEADSGKVKDKIMIEVVKQ